MTWNLFRLQIMDATFSAMAVLCQAGFPRCRNGLSSRAQATFFVAVVEGSRICSCSCVKDAILQSKNKNDINDKGLIPRFVPQKTRSSLGMTNHRARAG